MTRATSQLSPFPAFDEHDEHNRELLEQVHPADWPRPTPARRYNLVVIGGGTAGLVTAAAGSILGARVAMVERHLLGGDCLNTGCVPSKALIRAASAVHEASAAAEFGLAGDRGDGDFARVMERVRRLRAKISHHDAASRFRDLGVDVFLAEARFAGRDQVELDDGTKLRFRKAVIATGGRPVLPPIDGLEEAGYLTSETVFNLTQLPRRLMVVGGGPIGIELAQSFARLGSEVTIVEILDQFLPNEDPDAAAILAQALEQDGVTLRLGTRISSVSTTASGKQVTLQRNSTEETVEVDELLIGVGRAPNVESLNLEAVGVAFDHRGVQVDDRLRTTNRSIFAAGDVAMRHKFTHTADAAARIVIRNALFLGRKKLSSLVVPWCTYTSPEIAHVGMYESDARKAGIEVETIRVDMDDVDRAIVDGDERGFIKVHLKRGSDRILGATIVGEHAGDLISEVTLAMVSGVGLGAISRVIHPYPTRAEIIRKAADAYNRQRLTRVADRWLKHWFAWSR